jgi:hypothetical protein
VPALIALNVTPVGIETACGVVLFVRDAIPSWPSSFSPQQYALPPAVSAQTCAYPALISVNVTPIGIVTIWGRESITLTVIKEPFPNCPLAFDPQQYATPAVFNAQVKYPPVLICVNVPHGFVADLLIARTLSG